MTSEEAQAQHLIEWATQIAEGAYFLGFMASGEGWNAECPPCDTHWLRKRETDLSPLISQIRGESHETQED